MRMAAAGHPEPPAFWATWEWEPTILVGLLLAAGLYAVGTLRLRRRGGRAAPPGWRVWCFAGGLGAVALALLSPIAAYVPRLFLMDMTQHMLLIIVAAPLILLGAPLLPTLWARPEQPTEDAAGAGGQRRPLRQLGRLLTATALAAALFLGTVAGWHLPPLYDAAQGRTGAHDLEHLAFLGNALLYWWAIIQPGGRRRRLGYGLAIPYLLLSFVEGSVIGVWLTFAATPVYETYRDAPGAWGLSALADRQIGGLIMWVVGGAAYLVPLLVIIGLALREEEREVNRRLRRLPGL